jgi:hypothetical protein
MESLPIQSHQGALNSQTATLNWKMPKRKCADVKGPSSKVENATRIQAPVLSQ